MTAHKTPGGILVASTVPLLWPAEAARWADQVRAVDRAHWRPIDGDPEGWYSIGSALYLHFWDRDRRARATEENVLLAETFGPANTKSYASTGGRPGT